MVASHEARFSTTLKVWRSFSFVERSERLASLTDPTEAALTWLAHAAVCWQDGDFADCDAAFAEAEKLAEASGNAELVELVNRLRERLAEAASRSTISRVAPALQAFELIKRGKLEAATPLMEKALAEARSAGSKLGIATCLFFLAQILLTSQRNAEAVTALREALELATQSGDAEWIAAVQQLLTNAVRAAENS